MSFIQIGANDGLRNDPIRRHVLALGWNGVLVEPIPDAFNQLVDNYSSAKGLAFENVAICPKDGQTAFYLHPRHSDCSGLSIVTRIQRKSRMQCVTVNGMTFETLVNRHNITHCDLLQIDAEGYDYEIIKMVDFQRLAPGVIRYEHAHIDRLACREYLAARGYLFLTEGKDTIAYARHNLL